MSAKIAYAYKTGTSHLYLGLPCQDYAKGIIKNNTACIALADGAGSVTNSEIVSKLVVDTLLNEFTNNFDEWYSMPIQNFKTCFLNLCSHKVQAASPGLLPDSTLLMFAGANDGRSIYCHIGDGAMFGVHHDKTICTISKPENGDEPNQTFFLSGPDPLNHLRVEKNDKNNYKTVIICSDGTASPLWNGFTGEYAPAINRISYWIEHYAEEAVSRRLEEELDKTFREHTQDDMSLAVIHFA